MTKNKKNGGINMGLKAICDHCGKSGIEDMYLVSIRSLYNNEVIEPKTLCRECIHEIFDAASLTPVKAPIDDHPEGLCETNNVIPENTPDIPTHQPNPAEIPTVPAYGSEDTQFAGMPLRTFLNTQYYKTALKDVIFYDEKGSDIRNFHNMLDHTVRSVNEGKFKISVNIQPTV